MTTLRKLPMTVPSTKNQNSISAPIAFKYTAVARIKHTAFPTGRRCVLCLCGSKADYAAAGQAVSAPAGVATLREAPVESTHHAFVASVFKVTHAAHTVTSSPHRVATVPESPAAEKAEVIAFDIMLLSQTVA